MDEEQLNQDYLSVAKLAEKIRNREADARVELRAFLDGIKKTEGDAYYNQLTSMFGPGCQLAAKLAYNPKMPTPKHPHQSPEFVRHWLLEVKDWRDYYNCVNVVGRPMIKKLLPDLAPSRRYRFERYDRFISGLSQSQIMALLADPCSGALGERDQ